MKRIILILLWVITFWVAANLIAGAVFGILIWFGKFDLGENFYVFIGVLSVCEILGVVLGLYFGYKEKLPGTKRNYNDV